MRGSDIGSLTDHQLLQLVGAEDEGAFSELFSRYAPFARALALRVLRQPFLADEVVQEVFLSVWREPMIYDIERGSVRSWLLTLAHRRAVDIVRREESLRRVAGAASREPEETVDDHAEVLERSWLADERASIRRRLEELPPMQREVIELMYFAGLSQTKIAEQLGIPLGTVKSRSLLAMKRLRRTILAVDP